MILKPTHAQEAEALSLWEAGDLEGITEAIRKRDEYMKRYRDYDYAVYWKLKGDIEKAEARLREANALLVAVLERGDLNNWNERAQTHLSATKEKS